MVSIIHDRVPMFITIKIQLLGPIDNNARLLIKLHNFCPKQQFLIKLCFTIETNSLLRPLSMMIPRVVF